MTPVSVAYIIGPMGKMAELLQKYVTADPGRIQVGRSISDLARVFGVSREAASQWRSGETLPSPRRLPKIAAFCDRPLNEFVEAYNADKGINGVPSTGHTIMTGEDAMQLQLLLAELRKNTKVQQESQALLARILTALGEKAEIPAPPSSVNDNPPTPRKRTRKP